MNASNIGKVLGAVALTAIPATAGFYAFGRMKANKSSNGAASIVGGMVATVLGVGVAFADYYLLGLDTENPVVTAASMAGLLGPKAPFSSASYVVGDIPERVHAPFHPNFRQVGMIDVERAKTLGMLSVQRGQRRPSLGMINVQRVGCCGQ
jgi:hypothetical protein